LQGGSGVEGESRVCASYLKADAATDFGFKPSLDRVFRRSVVEKLPAAVVDMRAPLPVAAPRQRGPASELAPSRLKLDGIAVDVSAGSRPFRLPDHRLRVLAGWRLGAEGMLAVAVPNPIQ